MKLPFFQFFPADYKRDTCALSLAAKGGWIDVICMLHGAQNRGTMTLPPVGWARVMGSSVDQSEAVIAELAAMQIAEVKRECNGDVTISSRRMLREDITREQTRLRVQRHRCNAAGNGASNDVVTDKKTEDRRQKTETKNKDVGESEGEAGEPRAAGAAPTSDKDWLDTLRVDPAYATIDVLHEHAKALRWCLENRRQLTRRRFVNWLNRCDKPLSGIMRDNEGSVRSRKF